MIVTVLTLVIWMTQSLQRVDVLIENGRSFGVFLYLSLLVIPSLLVILIPFALFGACLYALYRMHSDSEIAVIFAAGISRLRIALPILIVTSVFALVTLYIALDLSPRTYRTLKQTIADIRTDIASSVLRSGEFIKILDGYTIYADEVRRNGEFTGLLVNDYTDTSETRTYMAERGAIVDTEAGPILLLVNGNVQRNRLGRQEVDILPFGETRINIASFQNTGGIQLELTERYLSELLNPDLTNEWDRRNAGKLIAEGHARLAAPFHAFAYVMVGLFALIGGSYNRRGYIARIVGAVIIVVGLRLASFIAQSFAENSGNQLFQYLVPGGAIILSLLLITGIISLPQINGPHLRLPTFGRKEAVSG